MSKPLKMPQLNEVRLVGRVTRDPDMRYTPSGAGVLNFSIAVDEFWTDKASGEKKKATSFLNCDLWGKGAEFHAKSLKKGAAVLVMGSLRSRTWEKDGQKHYTVEVRAQRVSTLEWESERGEAPTGDPGAPREPFDELPQDHLDDIPG
jgi:single-strand DNA-binding protein